MRHSVVVGLFSVVTACAQPDGGSGAGTAVADASVSACDEILARCESSLSEPGMDCHGLGHSGVEADCQARRAECLAECTVEGEPPGHGDGGH